MVTLVRDRDFRAAEEAGNFFILEEKPSCGKVPARRQKGCRTHCGHTRFFERGEKIQQEDLDALAFPMIPTYYPSQASSEPP
jgi:hypothetical protein